MKAEPNVTPMIDVMIVLLIAFMVLALPWTIINNVHLPDPRLDGPAPPVIVLVAGAGQTFRIDGVHALDVARGAGVTVLGLGD